MSNSMFCMLSCFNLKEDENIDEFRACLDLFSLKLIEDDLLESTTPITKRFHHPVLDTDKSNFEYFFTMKFKNEDQMERSVKYIFEESDPGLTLHQNVWKKIEQYNFICWQDI